MKLKPQFQRPDLPLLLVVLGLTIFGLVMIFDASVVIAASDFGDKFYFVKNQIIWAGFGLFGLSFGLFFDYHRYSRLSIFLLTAAIILLILVLISGLSSEVYGARRRLDFGPFSLQPGEFLKVAFIVYLSAWFAKFQWQVERKKLAIYFLLVGLILGLLLLQPDMGTAGVIVLSALVIFFLSGAPIWYFFFGIPFFALGFLGLIVAAPYRLARLKVLFNPTSDPQGISYHINQVLIALGSGGLLGLGLGGSRQKFEFLPEVATDSIFAIIAEELGFVGGLILIAVFLFLLWRGFAIARNAPDKFGFLLAAGITTWIGLQAFFNLGSMVALLPLTGLPLPFISYGGSSLIVSLFGVGVILNISRQKIAEK